MIPEPLMKELLKEKKRLEKEFFLVDTSKSQLVSTMIGVGLCALRGQPVARSWDSSSGSVLYSSVLSTPEKPVEEKSAIGQLKKSRENWTQKILELRKHFPDQDQLDGVLEKLGEKNKSGRLTPKVIHDLLAEWATWESMPREQTFEVMLEKRDTIRGPAKFVRTVYKSKSAKQVIQPSQTHLQTKPQSVELDISDEGKKRLKRYKLKQLWYSRSMKAFYPTNKYGKADTGAQCIGIADIPMELIERYEW
jgi:hypothetical protein